VNLIGGHEFVSHGDADLAEGLNRSDSLVTEALLPRHFHEARKCGYEKLGLTAWLFYCHPPFRRDVLELGQGYYLELQKSSAFVLKRIKLCSRNSHQLFLNRNVWASDLAINSIS